MTLNIMLYQYALTLAPFRFNLRKSVDLVNVVLLGTMNMTRMIEIKSAHFWCGAGHSRLICAGAYRSINRSADSGASTRARIPTWTTIAADENCTARYSTESSYSSTDSFSPESDKLTVCIEGNIAAGKSTFLEILKQNSDDVCIYPEPVSLWKNINGYNALDLMYKDPARWSLPFQSYVQLTMLEIHNAKQTAAVKLMERSLFSARYCFIENLHRSGCLPDFSYQVLNEWYNWIMENHKVNVDLIVYLRSSPEVCLERIKKRSRTEESTVSLDYLKSLHELHEDWLIHGKFQYPSAPVLIMNADKDLDEFRTEIEEKRTTILCSN